jgi:hypothetical protein
MSLRKVIHNNCGYVVTVFVLGIWFFSYGAANAAILQLGSNSSTLSPGDVATIVVSLNSEGVAINNAEAKIIFPSDLLEVVSISKVNSIFSLWVEEPVFSNSAGTINFNGGIPTPGFTGVKGTAISIVVKAKKEGDASVSFSEAAVRANDGFGTDVLRAKTGETLTVLAKEIPQVTEPSEPSPISTTVVLEVSSPTHPEQESWYQDSNPTFGWKLPAEVDAVQTGIDMSNTAVPAVTFSPAVSERTVKDLEDGVWYFKVRARTGGEWGPISTYVANIDSTAPRNNNVDFLYDDDTNLLSIKADVVDELSGIDHYEVFINDEMFKKVSPAEFVNGVYSISVDSPGNNLVRLVAVDRAGNSVESVGSFKVTAVPELPTEPISLANNQWVLSVGSFAMPLVYFIGSVLLGVLLVALVAFGLGCHYGKRSVGLALSTLFSKRNSLIGLRIQKKRLEKHLELLHKIRHKRILSNEEKKIKDAIEEDLDDVDRAIERIKKLDHGGSNV